MFDARPESCKAVMAHRLIRQRRYLAGLSLAFSATLLAGCSTPTRLSDSHVTSVPRSPAVDVAGLVCEPVATFGPVAAPAISGRRPPAAVCRFLPLASAEPRPPPIHEPI